MTATTGPASRLARWLWKPSVAASLALAASIVVFGWWPEIDLWFSGRFWLPGAGFIGDQLASARLVYEYTPRVGRVLLIGIVAVWLLGRLRPHRLPRRTRRTAALLLGAAVFGQGLLIDVALKDHWGRQRPRDTVVFGGAESFRPALQPGGNCRRNCSFVSGHAAAGFSLLGFGMLAPLAVRRRWMLAALATGGVIGLVRVAQGGHYLSDIVFSFFAVWLSTHLVWAALRGLHRVRAWRRMLASGRQGWGLVNAARRPDMP